MKSGWVTSGCVTVLVSFLCIGCEGAPAPAEAGQLKLALCEPTNGGVEICNGFDDDCNGKTDSQDGNNMLVNDRPFCEKQAGVCLGVQKALSTCSNGTWKVCGDPIYSALRPTYMNPEPTTNCDGVDNDCDGSTDEVYAQLPVNCGTGACSRTGHTACTGGSVEQVCTPGTPTTEVCNNADDDCDGAIDENLGTASCGVGVCYNTVNACVGGVPQTCVPGTPGVEACNGQDDDCNGETDDNLGVTACGVGQCATVVVNCVGGVSQMCTPGTPSVETCNGTDDDCDGDTDEGMALESTFCGIGACAATGHLICVQGAWSDDCVPTPAAFADGTCDLVDDDCDGQTDEDVASLPGEGTCGTGACTRAAQLVCEAGSMVNRCYAGLPAPEVCNGIDDDCNSKTDSQDGNNMLVNDRPFCEKQAGVCLGVQKALATCSGGTWRACGDPIYTALRPTYMNPEPTTNCDGVDNDCDGSIDEVYAQLPVNCGTGACSRTGHTACTGGAVEQVCTPGTPTTEVCNNVDDDCDGAVDENLGTASCGVGVCQNTVNACVGGETQTCVPGTPGVESCNGQDDDCNGETDDDLGVTACGVGQCAAVVLNCVDGVSQTCTPGTPGVETCNGTDDDCDSDTDEGCCVPACASKECGDDGCGGSCGTCTANETCELSGQCASLVNLSAGDATLTVPQNLAANITSFSALNAFIMPVGALAIGRPYSAEPHGLAPQQPVHLALPLDQSILDSFMASPPDVVLYSIGEGGEITTLVSHVSNDGLFVEADVSELSTYQLGIETAPGICDLKRAFSDLSLPVPQSAIDACVHLYDGDIVSARNSVKLTVDSLGLGTLRDFASSLIAPAQNSEPENVSGSWAGTIRVINQNRPFVFTLKQRANDFIIGYVPGGTRSRTISGGYAFGDSYTIVFTMEDPGARRSYTLTGKTFTIDGVRHLKGVGTHIVLDKIQGEYVSDWCNMDAHTCINGENACASDADCVMSFDLEYIEPSQASRYYERNMLMYSPGFGDFMTAADMAVVYRVAEDGKHQFLSGGWVSRTNQPGFPGNPTPTIPTVGGPAVWNWQTGSFGAGGMITTFRLKPQPDPETEPNSLDFNTAVYPGSRSCHATSIYSNEEVCPDGGAYDIIMECNIDGEQVAATIAALDLGSTSLLDIEKMIAMYDNLATAVEHRGAATYDDSIGSQYSHNGATRSDLVSMLEGLVANREGVEMQIGDIGGYVAPAEQLEYHYCDFSANERSYVTMRERISECTEQGCNVYYDVNASFPRDDVSILCGRGVDIKLCGNGLILGAATVPYDYDDNDGYAEHRQVFAYGVHHGEVICGSLADCYQAEQLGVTLTSHWQGHLAFDFQVNELAGGNSVAPYAKAVAGGEVVLAKSDNVMVRSGAYLISYGDLVGTSLQEGDPISVGDVIGEMEQRGVPGDVYYNIHLALNTAAGVQLCPYEFFGADVMQLLAQNNLVTRDVLIEPYACNGDRPMGFVYRRDCRIETRWDRVTDFCSETAGCEQDDPSYFVVSSGLADAGYIPDQLAVEWCAASESCVHGSTVTIGQAQNGGRFSVVTFGSEVDAFYTRRLIKVEWLGARETMAVVCPETCSCEEPPCVDCVCERYVPTPVLSGDWQCYY